MALDLIADQGFGGGRIASSISATVKLETPIWRASPSRLTLRARRAFRQAEFAGWASAAAADRPRSGAAAPDNRARRVQARAGAKCDGQIFVVTKTSSRLMPDARKPSPTSRSLSYISAVSMCR